MQSVGYREVQQMLDGQLTDSELSAAIVTSTMQLAKRQMTWFQRDTAIEWAPSSANFTEGMRALGALLDSGRP
jgi:tRNA dimethylallyltransferase